MYASLIDALPHALHFANLLAVVAGVAAGVVVGALPGLSATMAIAILIPFTFGMTPLVALGLMAGIYNGAMYGGAVPAVLLRIPGTPAAIATTFDGYPMAQQGKGGYALQVAVVSSALGGVASALALMLLSPPLAQLTLLFGPAEIFWVAVFAMVSIVFLLGDKPLKGIVSAAIGLLVSIVGADSITGEDRLTFGSLQLLDGINIVVVLIGLYAVPPIIDLLESKATNVAHGLSVGNNGSLWSNLPKMMRFWPTWLRSSVIGIITGILPGAGGSIGGIVSYNEAYRHAKDKSQWGNGEPEGIAASEAANNADTAAALIPTLTLGIPGTSVAAVMLGGLLIQGLQPGPMLFRDHADIVFGFMWQFLFGAIAVFILGGSFATNSFAQLLRIPKALLGSLIVALMFVGAYAIQNSIFDVYLMIGFGILGYIMEKLDYSLAPAVLGAILGTFAESNLRLALRIGHGDAAILWQNKLSIGIIALTIAVMLWPMIRNRLKRCKKNIPTGA